MESLAELTRVLRSLKQVSLSILTKGVGLLQMLDREDPELVKAYLAAKGRDATNTLIEEDIGDLQRCIDAAIDDAQRVHDEGGSFVQKTEEGGFAIGEDIDATPFLSEVWAGDVYGVAGVDALKQLLAALRARDAELGVEYVVEQAVAQ